MKRSLILISIFFCVSTKLFAQMVIDISTGRTNANTLINPTFNDDDWDVRIPNSTNYIDAKCTNGLLNSGNPTTTGVWAIGPNSRWISPAVSTVPSTFGYSDSLIGFPGTYTYRFTFTIPPGFCPPVFSLPFVKFFAIGGDDNIVSFALNGNPYPLSSGITFNPLTTNIQVGLNPTHFLQGVNVFTINVSNNAFVSNPDWTGLYVDGFIQLDTISANATLSNITINSNTDFCSLDTIRATATYSGGPLLTHQWRIRECDASGNIVTGFSYVSPALFPPVAFNYPISSLPCNRYYLLSVHLLHNGCVVTTHTRSRIIRVGCNNPLFSITTNSLTPFYYQVTATPAELNPFGTGIQWGQFWFLENLVSTTNNTLMFGAYNPNCWQTFTANSNPLSQKVNVFNGFNHQGNAAAYNSTNNITSLVNASCGIPVNGRFLYGNTYKITRTTFLSPSVCFLRQHAITFMIPGIPGQLDKKEPELMILNEEISTISEDEFNAKLNQAKEPGLSSSLPSLFPNPSIQSSTLSLFSPIRRDATIEVRNGVGVVVKTILVQINEGNNEINIQTTDLEDGLYLLYIPHLNITLKLFVIK
jgi:hypothetical protein